MGKTLSSQLVISLVDKVSGPASKINGALTKLQTQASKMGSVAQKLAGGTLSMAVPAGLSMAGLGHQELEWDELVHRFRAITEIADKDMTDLNSRIAGLSNKFGVGRTELLQGALAWKEAGGKLEEFSRSLETYTKIAGITKTTIAEASLETRGLMLAFGENVADPVAVKKMEEFFLVASKNIKGGAHALIEVMKQAAPIAAKLHIDKASLAALASVGVAEGFQPGEIGRGLKTVPMRLMAPSKDAITEMRAAQIDMKKLYGIDDAKMRDSSGLERALEANGLHVNDKVRKVILDGLTNADYSNGMGPVQDKLTKALGDALGMKKGDAQNRRILAKAIDQQFKRASTGLNLEELFKSTDLALSVLTPIFGKEHAAKMMAIFRQQKLFQHIRDEINEQSEGAIERKSNIFFEGFAFQWKRIKTNFENMLGSIGGSGIKNDLIPMFEGFANFLGRLQTADPALLRFTFWASATAASLPLLGIYVSTTAMAFGALAGTAAAATGVLGALGTGVLGAAGGMLRGLGAAARFAAMSLFLLRGAFAMGGIGGVLSLLGTGVAGIGSGIAAGFAALAGAAGTALVPILAIGAGMAVVAAAGVLIYNNLSGLGQFFAGIGEGFMKGLGPNTQRLISDIASGLGTVVEWLAKLIGPLDETGAKWRSWGETIGSVLAAPVRMLETMFNWIGKILDTLTFGLSTRAGKWLGDKLGIAGDPAKSPASSLVPVSPTTGTGHAPAGAGQSTSAHADLAKVQSTAAETPGAVQQSMSQVRQIVAAVDLTSEGERMMQSLAAGIRNGSGALADAVHSAVGATVRAAVRDSFADAGTR